MLSRLGDVEPRLTISNRVAFARALGAGEAVTEFAPSSKAAEEINQLWRYLWKHLRNGREA